MGDLPDFTQATSNAGTVLESTSIIGAGTSQLDVSNNNSLVIACAGANVTTKVVVQLDWFTDSTLAVQVNSQTLTSPAFTGHSGLFFEVPIYAGWLVITNRSGQTLAVSVVGSSRTVVATRVLYSTSPGRSFAAAGNFVNGTPFFCTANDGGAFGFASNGQTWVTVRANTNGTLFCDFVEWDGAVTNLPIVNVVANVAVSLFVALPQSVVDFFFDPSANNAAGTCVVNANPAQL